MTRKKQILQCLVLCCALALLHFLLDALCLSAVPEEGTVLIRGVVSLRYLKNTGAAFGLLSGHPLAANLLSAALLIGITAFMLFGKMRLSARLSLGAVLSGGACNLYMRLAHGGVNDWIELNFMRFPLFNFADICVCAGAALFVIFYLFAKEKRGK